MFKLCQIRSYYWKHKQIDITQYVMLTSQDDEIKYSLEDLNYKQEFYCHDIVNKWLILCDIPYVPCYITQKLIPNEFQFLLNEYVYNYYIKYDFSKCIAISLDLSFFDNNIKKIIQFINESNIPYNTIIILYNFPLNYTPITIENYHIVMQYDYDK